MSLTSSSTDAQVDAQWEDNVNYAAENSVAMCKLFLHANAMKINRTAAAMTHDGDQISVGDNLRFFADKDREAKAWLQSQNAGTLATVHVSLADYR